MSFSLPLFPWRTPMTDSWSKQLEQVTKKLDVLPSNGLDQQNELGRKLAVLLRQMATCRFDMMSQIQFEKVTENLWPARDSLGHIRPFKLGLVGNRTLTYLRGALRIAGLARGLLVETAEAPYDAAAAFAMGQIQPFANESLDAVLLFLDEGAFIKPQGLLDESGMQAASEKAAETLCAIAEGLRNQTQAPVIVPTIPLRPELTIASADAVTAATSADFLLRLNSHILRGARENRWLVWDLAYFAAQVGLNTWFDPVRFYQAKTPFAMELSLLSADHLCRLLAAMCGKAARALILDLDNTLWGGVVGDDGIEGIRIGQGTAEGEVYLAFQKLILDLRQRGIVLAVCSKNNHEIARQPFCQHPDMLLREDHIAVFQANWQDKATNIKAITETLNLSPESFVFVDDNPAERARVRQELPLVHVPEMGDNPAYYPHILTAGGYFEHLPLNADDLERVASYQSNAKRAEIKEKVGNYEEYLNSLRMELTIAPFDEIGRARIAQLVNKSNQFNLTTRRYNMEQITAFQKAPDVLGWQVRLKDMFGDHGMICVVIVKKHSDTWHIDTWLMSCRVLERGVEQAVMNELVKTARQTGTTYITGEYIPTERNAMVADFYEKMRFEQASDFAENVLSRLYLATYEPFDVFMNIVYHSET